MASSEVLVEAGVQPTYTTEVTVVNQPVETPGVTTTRKVVTVTVSRQGDGGGASGTAAFVHTQDAPASEWSVAHPFKSKPVSVQLEIDGRVVIPDVLELSAERVVLAFNQPSTGTLTLLKG